MSKRSQSNNSKTAEAVNSTQTPNSSEATFTSKEICSSQETASSQPYDQTYIDEDQDGYSIEQMLKLA